MTLRGPCSVPLAALQLSWDLEARGFNVTEAPDGALLVSPREQLTPTDDRAIRAYRDQLLTLVRYTEREQ